VKEIDIHLSGVELLNFVIKRIWLMEGLLLCTRVAGFSFDTVWREGFVLDVLLVDI
jgi:hypothetical protein